MPSYTRIWHRPTKKSTPTKTRILIYTVYIYIHIIYGFMWAIFFPTKFVSIIHWITNSTDSRFLVNISSKHATSRFFHQSASPPLSNFVFWSVHLSQQISRFHGFPFGDWSSYLFTSHLKNHPFTSHLPEKKVEQTYAFDLPFHSQDLMGALA